MRSIAATRIKCQSWITPGMPAESLSTLVRRLPVELLLRKLGEGATVSELLDAYPRLTKLDVQAALSYAADTIAHEVIVPIPS